MCGILLIVVYNFLKTVHQLTTLLSIYEKIKGLSIEKLVLNAFINKPHKTLDEIFIKCKCMNIYKEKLRIRY